MQKLGVQTGKAGAFTNPTIYTFLGRLCSVFREKTKKYLLKRI